MSSVILVAEYNILLLVCQTTKSKPLSEAFTLPSDAPLTSPPPGTHLFQSTAVVFVSVSKL